MYSSETAMAAVYCSTSSMASLSISHGRPHRQRASPVAGGVYVPSASRPDACMVMGVPPLVGPPVGSRKKISLPVGST